MTIIDMIKSTPNIETTGIFAASKSTEDYASNVVNSMIDAKKAFLRLAKVLAETSMPETRKAEGQWKLDGFILTIPGHHGDIAWHTGTDYKYETYGTIVDAGDCTRHDSAIEAALALLATPENYEYREVV